ncbi:unnamed protein product [Paramecium octaurelia]|uniref:Amidohydrolase 3 domain-containing protein n=1 Tax=Paramecium octaurelia TaxID=43137 RepID=A0A8S1XKR7_PAROT|nr:unnamed protein product [Paramecium octaurelia]
MNNHNQQLEIIVIGTIYISFEPLVQVECMLIKAGKVSRLGQTAEILNQVQLQNELLQEHLKKPGYWELQIDQTKIIKLNELQMAMPGMIDSHVHPQSGGIQLSRLTIQKYCSWEDAKNAIRNSIEKGEHDKYEWVFAYGYSQGWFKENKQNIQELDDVCPEKPLIIMRDDCHAYWCNSKIFEVTQTHQEDGIYIEEQMNAVRKYIPKLSEIEQQNCLLKGLQHLVNYGIVAFQDAAVKEKLFHNYKKLYQNQTYGNQLPYCCMSLCWNDLFLEQTQNVDEEVRFETVENQIKEIRDLNLEKLYCHSVKIFVDGVVESKTALMNVKYCQCSHNGQLMIQNVPQIIEGLNDRGIQAHIHSIGDRATDIVVEAFERISHKLNKNVINYLAHLEFVSPKAIELFKKLNLGANFSALWFYESPSLSLMPTCLPQHYMEGMYPIRDLEQCIIGLGSDWPVSSANPFYAIEVAVTRQPLGHNQNPIPIGDLKQRITIQQALHYYTEGSAKLIQKPGFGLLTEGGHANFIIISQNVLKVNPSEIHQTQVLSTFIDGVEVYQSQKLEQI